MNKILRYSFLLLMAFLGVNANAAVDVLTYDVLLESGKGNAYQDFSGKTISSTAVYAGNASSGADKYIQLRTNNNNAGIVTTASGGKLTSVTIKFNSATTDRKIQVYGSNSAYSAATDLYGDAAGDLLGEIAANDASMTLNVSGNYTYVGLRSANGAIYVDQITIGWDGDTGGGDTPPTPPQPSGEPKGNGTLSDPFNSIAANNYVSSLEADVTTTEDIYIKGKIAKIANNGEFSARYGNASFYISDDGEDNGTFYVFRTLYLGNRQWVDGDTQIQVGDEVIVCGKVVYYQGKTPETSANNSYLYSLNGKTDGGTVQVIEAGSIGRLTDDMNNKTVKLTLNNAEVVHAWESNNGNKQVFVRDKTAACQFYNIGFDLAKGDILNGSITAKYTLYNGNPEMTTPVADNSLSISKGPAEPQPQKITIADAKNYLCDLVEISNVSLIEVQPESSAKGTRAEAQPKYYIVDDSDNQLQLYNGFHDSAYDDLHEFLDQTDKTIVKGIIISTKTDPELYIVEIVTPAGVNGITADTKANGPIYNVAGQRVNKAVKGVYIQNGKKFVVK